MSYKSFLEITDMPSDNLQALGKLRTVLVATFNQAREHKHRMALLKKVIKFMHTKSVEFEKEEARLEEIQAQKEEAQRIEAAQLAKELADKETNESKETK